MHPDEALFQNEKPYQVLPSCVHYAGSQKLMEKALLLQKEKNYKFHVTLDCEDGAKRGEEEAHIRMACSLIESPLNGGNATGIRIHEPSGSIWQKELEIIFDHKIKLPAFLVIPKSSSLEELKVVLETLKNVYQSQIPVHVLIETHGALKDVNKIAEHPLVETLDFGIMDFISAHHGAIAASNMKSPGQFDHVLLRRAKSEICSAALACGKVPVHNVSLSLKDPATVKNDALRARYEFGFLRMWSIHPSQIDPIIEAMSPTHEELHKAIEILIRAQDLSWAPIDYQGELCDRASYRIYWSLLKSAKMNGIPFSNEVLERFWSVH